MPQLSLPDRVERRVDGLARAMVAEFVSSIAVYRTLPPEQLQGEIHGICVTNLRSLFTCLREGRPPAEEELSAIRASAARRAARRASRRRGHSAAHAHTRVRGRAGGQRLAPLRPAQEEGGQAGGRPLRRGRDGIQHGVEVVRCRKPERSTPVRGLSETCVTTQVFASNLQLSLVSAALGSAGCVRNVHIRFGYLGDSLLVAHAFVTTVLRVAESGVCRLRIFLHWPVFRRQSHNSHIRREQNLNQIRFRKSWSIWRYAHKPQAQRWGVPQRMA